MNLTLFHFCLLISTFNFVNSAKILFYIGVGSFSHRTALEPLGHKLVEEGHDVTFLTPIPPTKPNPKFVEFSPRQLSEFYNVVVTIIGDRWFHDRLKDKYFRPLPDPPVMQEFEQVGCSILFTSPEFGPWLNRSHFDLVILEHGANKCGYGLAQKWNAPVILFSPTILFLHEEDNFGWPVEYSWLPTLSMANVYTNGRTFYDKLYTTFFKLYSMAYSNWWGLPTIDKLVRDSLEWQDMPSIRDMEKNTSLIFINQHFSADYAMSLPPMVVPVGGMHCNDVKNSTLPKDLAEFVDGAGEDGFVYISFGTIITMSKVPKDIVDALFKAVGSRKTRFLWKWDGQPPENLPSNVKTASFFPQQEILGHPKIRGFMTQGGMMSIQQAVYFGVPVIVVPVIHDQPYNAQVMELHGMGIHLELSEMKEKFNDVLSTILDDKTYSINAKLASERFRDRPMSAVDTASYWTNYVLRHKDSMGHLKPLGVHQSWWERRLLDVWLFIFVTICVLIYILWKVGKTLYFLIRQNVKHWNGKKLISDTKLKTN